MNTQEKTRLNSYDRIAPYYDGLAKIVFGDTLHRAQGIHLSEIPDRARVLIIGGGTGWILEELLRQRPHASICYIDASGEMIRRARKRVSGSRYDVTFVHGDESLLQRDVSFEVVIANFFLDQFDDNKVKEVVTRMRDVLTDTGIFLVTDFQNNRAWMGLLLNVMYSFFRTVGAISTQRLPMWIDEIQRNGFRAERDAAFFHGFIRSMLFRKKTII